MASDTKLKNQYSIELGPKTSDDSTFDLSVYDTAIQLEEAYNRGLYKKINDATTELNNLLQEKKAKVAAFERLMGPAMREGYWQP